MEEQCEGKFGIIVCGFESLMNRIKDEDELRGLVDREGRTFA